MSKNYIANCLIVDDDESFHEILNEGFPMFNYKSAYNCDDAKILLQAHRFTFILLDYRLQDSETGLELINFIREINPLTLIFMISAYGTNHVLKESIDFKIDGFLEKPIRQNDFSSKVIDLLDQKGRLNQKTINDSISQLKQTVLEQPENVNDIVLTDFANSNKKSYKYLSQKFKKDTGTTFQKFKKNERYKLIQDLLISTSLSIKDIAYQFGFSSPSSLMRGFKQFTGQTITEYRKKHSNS